MTAEVLRAQLAQAQADVARHKAAIRRLREQLGQAAHRVRELEARCQQVGIGIVRVQKSSGVEEEESSWPSRS